MPLDIFHPLIARWFAGRFDQPTEAQRVGWPAIAARQNVLIAAPTGSGKTLTAFLWCIDDLLRQSLEGKLEDGVQVVYVSPLKALSNDIHRNLEVPLAEILDLAAHSGAAMAPIRAAVRTGDTPSKDRQAMLRRPPHILVTTPESLYLLLTSSKSRDMLRGARTVIVDEIHALARDKRGSHLALTLERLDVLVGCRLQAAGCRKSEAQPVGSAAVPPTQSVGLPPLQPAACSLQPPLRIGLSATQRPMDEIARFLVGTHRVDAGGRPDCQILDTGHQRQLDLAVEVPEMELSAVCSNEQWDETYDRLVELIESHRSTLVFVGTRSLAERVAHRLRERLGEEAVASHHGSLAREIRLSAEERLKTGQLKAVVATASLEMGIDVGFIDLVCHIGAPRSIATLLQRVGRSGHALGVVPRGRIFPLTRDELLQSLAVIRAVRAGRLDRIEIPIAPRDILAQQVVAAAASDTWNEDDLYQLCRGAWPYRDLPRQEFDRVVALLSEGVDVKLRRGRWLHRDAIGRQIKGRRGARLAAVTSGGAIPENADYRVVTEEGTFVGTLNEDFAIESMAGDIFLLGNTSWRIRHVRGGVVTVADAQGAPATIPFWLGEAPARTNELSSEVSSLREELAERIELQAPGADASGSPPSPPGAMPGAMPTSRSRVGMRSGLEVPSGASAARSAPATPVGPQAPGTDASGSPPSPRLDAAIAWLHAETGAGDWAARQAVLYVAAQKAAVGLVPMRQRILFERFFDESGGMQLVVHAPLGARINRAWGLALRKRFCRSFDFELQAAATDDGVLLSIGPQHSFPTDALFRMINTGNARYLLEQALLAAPMFPTRWRWNITRALAVLRMSGGKKVPPHLQRFRSDDLLSAVFPQSTGCLENHHGDVEIPDHPLVKQTVDDCMVEAMDLEGWLGVLADIAAGRTELVARETREPSPFSHEVLNANPYAFLDDAPLEERRVRAVTQRRGLSIEAVRDLDWLDPEAIAQVRAEAWPVVRDADELHDALLTLGALPAEEGWTWSNWFGELLAAGRATVVTTASGRHYWCAAERWPLARAAWPECTADPLPHLPESLDGEWEPRDAWGALVRGHLQASGPTTAAELANRLDLEESQTAAALEALEGEGLAMRGRFVKDATKTAAMLHIPTDAVGGLVPPLPAACGLQPAASPQPAASDWCDRRLLARIHRLTLDGLRRQVQPVDPADFMRFLLRHQRVLPELRLRGKVGVRRAVEQLQGLEIAARAWEGHVLAARLDEYDPAWLDALSLSGEVAWARLRGPRRDDDDLPSGAALTRAVPITLAAREHLRWLLPPERWEAPPPLRGNARLALETLEKHGALFYADLLGITALLPTQLEDALKELAAQGLVMSDAFGAVRALVGRALPTRRRAGKRSRSRRGAMTLAGRWSLLPGLLPPAEPLDRIERWARLLLERWGVMFRDLLQREAVAPPWHQLVGVYRRMEARGEIRGGRFVAGVAGEQYALPSAVDHLRRVRDEAPDGQDIILSAADPLNLLGIVLPGVRLPAVPGNSLALRDGRVTAIYQAGETHWSAELKPEEAAEMQRQLIRTG